MAVLGGLAALVVAATAPVIEYHSLPEQVFKRDLSSRDVRLKKAVVYGRDGPDVFSKSFSYDVEVKAKGFDKPEHAEYNLDIGQGKNRWVTFAVRNKQAFCPTEGHGYFNVNVRSFRAYAEGPDQTDRLGAARKVMGLGVSYLNSMGFIRDHGKACIGKGN